MAYYQCNIMLEYYVLDVPVLFHTTFIGGVVSINPQVHLNTNTFMDIIIIFMDPTFWIGVPLPNFTLWIHFCSSIFGYTKHIFSLNGLWVILLWDIAGIKVRVFDSAVCCHTQYCLWWV